MQPYSSRSECRTYEGTLGYYSHDALSTNCTMNFSAYVPDAAKQGPLPVLFYLSGLTCTEDNFTTKAGAYRLASKLGCVIVAPDTSPRGETVPDDEAWDFAKGAGFYLDATQPPWNQHYKMYTYIINDLVPLIDKHFPVDSTKRGIFGHSMGGHGALTIYLKNQQLFSSVSAFAPIVAPTQCPWGLKAFSHYLGDDKNNWLKHDACHLMETSEDRSDKPEILIDQGLADSFLDDQLKPDLFVSSCQKVNQKLILRKQPGYDHSYFFIQSFIDDHIQHHLKILNT